MWPSYRRSLVLLLPLLALPISGNTPLFGAEPPPGEAFQVADLATGPLVEADSPVPLAAVGGRVLFAARDQVHGLELWVSDGTTPGTALLADLCPGTCHSYPRAVASLGGQLVFTAQDGAGAPALWATDGTAEGTVVLSRGSFGIAADRAVLGDRLYLAGGDPAHGFEVWTTDGTPDGTERLADLCPGPCSSAPRELTALGDLFLFTALTEEGDGRLWRSDGTAAGTFAISDPCPGDCDERPESLVAADGRVFFSALDGVHGRELWVSDGTPGGTHLLHDLAPGGGFSVPFPRFGFDGSLYFRVGLPGQLPYWRTDGTPGGAEPASELFPYGPDVEPQDLSPLAGRLWFTLRMPQSSEEELWVVDGPGLPARRLETFSEIPLDLSPSRPESYLLGAELDGELLFGAIDPVGQNGLWTSDGTPAGTRRVRDFGGPGGEAPGSFLPAGEWVYFAASEGGFGQQLWRTDGTAAGTARVSDPVLYQPGSDPRALTAVGRYVYFQVEQVPAADGLWRTTGPAAGAERVLPDRIVSEPTALGNRLFFFDGPELLPAVLTGSETAPTILSATGFARELTAAGDRVFFAAGNEGQQLWTSGGTPESTRRVVDVNPSWEEPCDILPPCGPPSYPFGLTAAGNRVFFVAASETAGELWVSDGTAAGTIAVPGAPPDPIELTRLGSGIVFLGAGPPGSPRDLWRSDGTAEGTVRILAEIPEASPRSLVAADGLVYFVTSATGGATVLWRTDGTPAGTFRLLQADTGGGLGSGEMVPLGRSLYFTHVDAAGEELWTSDGTPAGTRRLLDLRPGPRGSNPSGLTVAGTVAGDLLLFAADDGETGHEPWVSDGTAAATHPLADVHPGPEPSSPGAFAVAGPWAFFDAHDGITGRELWAARLAPRDDGEPAPPRPDSPAITSPEAPGFRFWVRITGGAGQELPARREQACLPETVCVSGAVPGRSELFLRVVGPKPNGRLWPTLVRFSTSTIEVWIEQTSTGLLRYYRLEGATPGSSSLDGLFDRQGFPSGD